MKRVAITGGIGSGKSTVAEYIKNLGYPVFSCDDIYREIIQSSEYIQKIKVYFPDCVIHEKIDRTLLSKAIFSNQEKRQLLNSIAHPIIMERLFTKMDACKAEYVFAEVPLLFEGKFEKLFDRVIVVTREKEGRILALQNRDNMTREIVEQKISSQFDYASMEGKKRQKECKAIEIKNNHSLDDLRIKIQKILDEM